MIFPALPSTLPHLDVATFPSNWPAWRQAFEVFLAASCNNELGDRQKLAILLHCIGVEGREMVSQWIPQLRAFNSPAGMGVRFCHVWNRMNAQSFQEELTGLFPTREKLPEVMSRKRGHDEKEVDGESSSEVVPKKACPPESLVSSDSGIGEEIAKEVEAVPGNKVAEEPATERSGERSSLEKESSPAAEEDSIEKKETESEGQRTEDSPPTDSSLISGQDDKKGEDSESSVANSSATQASTVTPEEPQKGQSQPPPQPQSGSTDNVGQGEPKDLEPIRPPLLREGKLFPIISREETKIAVFKSRLTDPKVYLSLADFEEYLQAGVERSLIDEYLLKGYHMVINNDTLEKYPPSTHRVVYAKYAPFTTRLYLQALKLSTATDDTLQILFEVLNRVVTLFLNHTTLDEGLTETRSSPVYPKTIKKLTLKNSSAELLLKSVASQLEHLSLVNSAGLHWTFFGLKHLTIINVLGTTVPRSRYPNCPNLESLHLESHRIEETYNWQRIKKWPLKSVVMLRIWKNEISACYNSLKSLGTLESLKIIEKVPVSRKGEIEALGLKSVQVVYVDG